MRLELDESDSTSTPNGLLVFDCESHAGRDSRATLAHPGECRASTRRNGYPHRCRQLSKRDLSAWRDESTNNRTSQQELHVSREATGSVPTVTAVKQLVSAWAQKRYDMLKIRGGARRCSESRRIQRAACAGEEDEADEAATDLEAARPDVLVWQTIAREVEDRSEEDRREPGPTRGTGCGARRHVERNDHTVDAEALAGVASRPRR
jgi:hypothetical protein